MRWTRYLLALVAVGTLNCVPVPVVPEGPPFLYETIVFDIAYVGTTSAPRQGALDHFRRSLQEQRICVADGVRFDVRRATNMVGESVWSVPTFVAFEQTNGGRSSRYSEKRDPDLRVFVAFVHGIFLSLPEDLKLVCGYCYGHTSFAALVDVYSRSTQEAALMLHEFGHVLDLRGDDHCADDKCVMYEYVRSDGARFCAACLDRINLLRRR